METGAGPFEHGGRPGPEDRLRSEAARREEEFRLLADSMPQFVFIAGPSGDVRWFSRRWYEYTGLGEERSAGWGWRHAHHPAGGDVVERVRALVATGETWETTFCLRGRDGSYRRFLARAVPLRDEAGRIVRWIGTSTDVEDQLRAKEEAERFFAMGPDPLCVATTDGRFLRVNPALVRVLGWSEGELLGRPYLELVHPDDLAATRGAMARLARGEVIDRFENRCRTRAGDYVVLAWAASPVTAQGVLYVSARDITDQRRLEAERGEMLAMLDTLIDTAPVGLAFFDRDLRYVRINRILAGINGRPVADHVGRTLAEVRPDLVDVVEPALRQVFETGEPLLGREIVDPSPGTGRPTHRLVGFYPVKDARGRIFLAGVVVVDISAQKRTEAALERTAEFRERFLGIVAHDLRNPLAAIASGAALLQRVPDLPERERRLAKGISAAAARMGKIIADVVDFTRVRLGSGLSIERAPVELRELVGQVLDELEVAYPDRRVERPADGPVRGEWDPGRLGQLVSNLVKNALDYGPPGSPVAVSLAVEEGEVRIVVTNRNLGGPIPAEALPTLFDPFRRAQREGTRKTEGLGLGLYIAREIALAHGGTISVASDEEGTRFTVRLPRSAPPAAAAR
jgi:PAS domain S-box-containing protein